MGETNLAIACQGGGSHTAFTAGVLRGVLDYLDEFDRYDLVGLSGTSGGALSALVAWFGLLTEGPDAAMELLEAVWADLAADGLGDQLVNGWVVQGSRLRSSGFPVPEFSPYQVPMAAWGQDRIRRVMERHVDFEAIDGLAGPSDPQLIVGTVDVNGGEFETFVDGAVTPEAMLATMAVPDIFEAVEIHGHWHWDGLFSQNPPIHDLMTVPAHRKPDELLVVQINPQTRDGEPRSLMEIHDRRNELAGNLAMNQELRFIETVNRWIEAGHLPNDQYSKTTIHRLEFGRELHCSTKVDRSPAFIEELIQVGEERASNFLSSVGTVS